MRLTTRKFPVELKNIEPYVVEQAHETILGLPFTEAIGFDINDSLVNNYEALNGTELRKQDASDEAEVRQVRHARNAAYYVPNQMEPRAPLEDADPLDT